MSSYTLVGIENFRFSEDRTHFEIQFRTDKGRVILKLRANHLDQFITTLENLEHKASLLDPVAGQQPNEHGRMRAQVVERHQIMHAEADGVPSILLGLKAGPTFRWFALDTQQATSIQHSLANEIPKMKAGPVSH